jgi:hypothetical protein
VARVHKKYQALRFTSVEHIDEELHRRLNYVQRSAAHVFTVGLSEDRKNVICRNVRTGKVRFVAPVDVLPGRSLWSGGHFQQHARMGAGAYTTNRRRFRV